MLGQWLYVTEDTDPTDHTDQHVHPIIPSDNNTIYRTPSPDNFHNMGASWLHSDNDHLLPTSDNFPTHSSSHDTTAPPRETDNPHHTQSTPDENTLHTPQFTPDLQPPQHHPVVDPSNIPPSFRDVTHYDNLILNQPLMALVDHQHFPANNKPPVTALVKHSLKDKHVQLPPQPTSPQLPQTPSSYNWLYTHRKTIKNVLIFAMITVNLAFTTYCAYTIHLQQQYTSYNELTILSKLHQMEHSYIHINKECHPILPNITLSCPQRCEYIGFKTNMRLFFENLFK